MITALSAYAIVLLVQMKPVQDDSGKQMIAMHFRNVGDDASYPWTISLPCHGPSEEKEIWAGSRDMPVLKPGEFYAFSIPITHQLPAGEYSCTMQRDGTFQNLPAGRFDVTADGKIVNHQDDVVNELTPKMSVSGKSEPGAKTGFASVIFAPTDLGKLPNRITWKVDGKSLGPTVVVKKYADNNIMVPVADLGLTEGSHTLSANVESIYGDSVDVTGTFDVATVIGDIVMMEPPYEAYKSGFIVKGDKPVFQYRLTDGTIKGLSGQTVTCTVNFHEFPATTNGAGAFDCPVNVATLQYSTAYDKTADPHLRSGSISASYQRKPNYPLARSVSRDVTACEAGYDIVRDGDRLSCTPSIKLVRAPAPTVNPAFLRPPIKPPIATLPPPKRP